MDGSALFRSQVCCVAAEVQVHVLVTKPWAAEYDVVVEVLGDVECCPAVCVVDRDMQITAPQDMHLRTFFSQGDFG